MCSVDMQRAKKQKPNKEKIQAIIIQAMRLIRLRSSWIRSDSLDVNPLFLSLLQVVLARKDERQSGDQAKRPKKEQRLADGFAGQIHDSTRNEQ